MNIFFNFGLDIWFKPWCFISITSKIPLKHNLEKIDCPQCDCYIIIYSFSIYLSKSGTLIPSFFAHRLACYHYMIKDLRAYVPNWKNLDFYVFCLKEYHYNSGHQTALTYGYISANYLLMNHELPGETH